MLKAFLDESGIHSGSKVCVVAGFVAPADFCDDLQFAWQHHLKAFDVRFFHAKHFSSGRGPFFKWDDLKRREFIMRSNLLLEQEWKGYRKSDDCRNDVVFLAAAVETKPFFRLSLDERRWLTGGVPKTDGRWKHPGAPTKAYFLPFQQCITAALKFAPYRERINFIFDWQTHYEHTGKRIFSAIRKRYRTFSPRMGAVVYDSSQRAVPLQVADFIAYELHRIYTAYLSGHSERSHFIGRTAWQPWGATYSDAEGLKQLLSKCPITPRQSFVIPEPTRWTPARSWRDQDIIRRRAS